MMSTPVSSQAPSTRRVSRWWIAAVIPAIVLMLVASGYRVADQWYRAGPHQRIGTAEPGQWVDVSWPYTDAFGPTTRTFSVRFAGWGSTSRSPVSNSDLPITLPPGLIARTALLDFRAAPDQELHCQLSLTATDGREFDEAGQLSIGPYYPCVPSDTPGPSLPVSRDEPRGKGTIYPPRPAQWSTAPVFVTPEDLTFVEIRILYEYPRYVSLLLPS